MLRRRLVGKRAPDFVLAVEENGPPSKIRCTNPVGTDADTSTAASSGLCQRDDVDGTPQKENTVDVLACSSTPPKTLHPPGVVARTEWRKSDSRYKQELALMKELRRVRDAPVDMLFTPQIADETASPETKAFHVFVAVFLSSQTRDEVTAQAMQRLKDKTHGLSIESVKKAREGTLAKAMKPVAFHNTKAKNLKAIARSLTCDHAGKVPLDADALCEMPGIGPKMAHIIVSILTGSPQGIGIDVHLHRITNRLGWVSSKEPEQTRLQLQKMLPYQEWVDVNLVMVGLGQQMNSDRKKLLQRCLQSTNATASLKLVQRLGLNLNSVDKASGQGVLHWAASAGNPQALQMLVKCVKPVKDHSGLWPWDVATSDVASVLEKMRRAAV